MRDIANSIRDYGTILCALYPWWEPGAENPLARFSWRRGNAVPTGTADMKATLHDRTRAAYASALRSRCADC